MPFDYIDDEYARGYVSARYNEEAEQCVRVPIAFIDMNGGNLYDAIIFSQIMYWHMPSKRNGKTKLRYKLNGHLWLVKNHKDWYEETRINASTVRKCLDRIRDRGLIIYELHGSKGNVSPYMRINWRVFSAKMKEWEKLNVKEEDPLPSEDIPLPYQGIPLIPQGIPLPSENSSNTENTTENTNKDSLKESNAPKSVQPKAPLDLPLEPSYASVSEAKEDKPKKDYTHDHPLFKAIAFCDPKNPTKKIHPVSKTHAELLQKPGNGPEGTPSPCELYETRDLFRQYVQHAIQDERKYAKQSHPSVIKLARRIQGFDWKNGWFAYEAKNRHFETTGEQTAPTDLAEPL